MSDQLKELKIVVYNSNKKVIKTCLMELTDEETMVDELWLPEYNIYIKIRYKTTDKDDYEVDSVDLEHTDESDSCDSCKDIS